jgi:hypothetical protein
MSIINFYELDEVKELSPQYHNPNYNEDTMPMKHPERIIILAPSGGGKTNLLLGLIKAMNGTYKCIILFTQNKNEPLYEYLEKKIPYPQFQIYEGIKEVMKFNFDNLEEEQTLIVFDDMVSESFKNHEKIINLFIRGRKMAGMKGLSIVYLTQNYYKVPKAIRGQATKLFIRKINSQKDLSLILSDCGVGASMEQLKNMYEYCCDPKDIKQFLLIDYEAFDDRRFRKGLDEILDISFF